MAHSTLIHGLIKLLLGVTDHIQGQKNAQKVYSRLNKNFLTEWIMKKCAKSSKSMENCEGGTVESRMQRQKQLGPKIPMERSVKLWHYDLLLGSCSVTIWREQTICPLLCLSVTWSERSWVLFIIGLNMGGFNVKAPSAACCLLSTVRYLLSTSYVFAITVEGGPRK
jgi:hypothetical protein